MSTLKRIMSGQGRILTEESQQDSDLERGLETSPNPCNEVNNRRASVADDSDYHLPRTIYQPASPMGGSIPRSQSVKDIIIPFGRVSSSDSEFSDPAGPVSPERYYKAWDKLSANSPTTPKIYKKPGSPNVSEGSESGPLPRRNTNEGILSRGHSELLARLGPGSSQTDSSSSKNGGAPLRLPIGNRIISTRLTPDLEQNGGSDSTRDDGPDWQTMSDMENGSGGPITKTETPRYHRAFSFLNNNTMGETLNTLHKAGLSQGKKTYQHPAPLSGSHKNPFNASPPVIKGREDPSEKNLNSMGSSMGSEHDRKSKASILTNTFDELVETHGSSFESARGEDRSSGRDWTTTETDAERYEGLLQVSVPAAKELGSSLAGVSSPPSTLHKPGSSSIQRVTTFKHRHRRSSSASKCELTSSPTTSKTSALASPDFRGHRKRNTMTGLLPSGKSSFYSDEETPDRQYQPNLRERNIHQAYTDGDEISSVSGSAGHYANTYRDQISPMASSTGLQVYPNRIQTSQASTHASSQTYPDHDQTVKASMFTESRAFVQDGVVVSDVPRPVFVHPVYGLERPWDTPTRGRPQARRDRYQRPISCIESPHLHRIPRPPTAAMRRRRKEISALWLPIFCIIPPVALIFGHGLADELIRMQTDGEIDTFAENSKTTALWWGYLGTPVMIAIIFLAIFFGTS